MTEKLTGKQIVYLTDLDERDELAEALQGQLEVNNTALPTFNEWVLLDTKTCRIYAVFNSPDEIAAYITHPMYPTMMEKIICDRRIAVYVPERERDIVRVELNQYAPIKLMKADIEVYVSHTVDGTPMKWTIGIVGSQFERIEIDTPQLLETGFDVEVMRKLAENADFSF